MRACVRACVRGVDEVLGSPGFVMCAWDMVLQ